MKLFTLEVLAALEAELISRFGADAPQNIAVLNGYADKVGNPDYVKGNGDFVETKIDNPDYIPAVGSPQIIDPAWLEAQGPDFDIVTFDGEVPTIDNPDYVAAVGEPKIDNPDYVADQGEPTIDNPLTHMQFIMKTLLGSGYDKVTKPYLNQVKEENGANGLALAEPLVQEGKEIITNLV